MKLEERLTYPRGHSGGQPSFTRDAIHARDSYSLPPQSVLHREDVADAPLDVAAFFFVGAFTVAFCCLFAGIYFFAWFVFD